MHFTLILDVVDSFAIRVFVNPVTLTVGIVMFAFAVASSARQHEVIWLDNMAFGVMLACLAFLIYRVLTAPRARQGQGPVNFPIVAPEPRGLEADELRQAVDNHEENVRHAVAGRRVDNNIRRWNRDWQARRALRG